jgi:phosphoglycerol transferase MdoB-like AlkP superfamily enzyme
MKRSKLLSSWHEILNTRPVAALAALSAAIELFIELLGRREPVQALLFLVKSPHIFLMNAAIVFSTLMFTLLLRRKAFYSILITLIWITFGVVNLALLSMRATPFSARDLSIAASGLRIADVYFSPWEIALLCAAAAAFALFVVLLYTRAPRSKKSPNLTKEILIVASVAVTLGLFGFFAGRNGSITEQYESINEACEMRGFPYCFAHSLFKSGVSRPEDYSEETVNELDVDPVVTAAKRPNIILVQLESFFDPALIKDVELSENPIPNFTSLRDSCASGFLRMPTLGAGTVNAEFEVLTGMSLDFFGLNEYPYESILRENTCESVAYYLKDLGYGTHAIHNYAGSFYGRNEVYPNLGFDDFTSVEYMEGLAFTEKGWPKDAVLTKYILQALEKTETPDFVFTVTVQCHGKYPDDSGIDDISFRDNEVFEEDASEQFLYFASQLQETDRFLGELIAALKNYDEETVVVAYGDHLPTLDLTEEDLVNGTLFETQYFLWSNYGIGVGGEDADLWAYQLTARLLDAVGIRGGVITDYHREHRGMENYQEGLELLEYDLLYGDQIAYGGASPYERTDMKMGLEEIVVNEVVFGDTTVEIRGSGFTEYSVVYVNGKRNEDTVFVSPERLLIPNNPRLLRPGVEFRVCQTGEDRIILSTAGGRS